MASLDHENIVKIYDISQDDEVPFIVAECVSGRDVGGMLKQAPGGRLEEGEVREISSQLLRALSYAHRRGVIHSDIKPSNILTTEEGKVKVADFGIARIVESEEAAGEPGEIIGSARYMSPEQLRGEETTPRSDVYSVGILLYHCLTGRPPFSGDPKTVARRHASEIPTPPRRLNKKISARMEAVILKALSKNPENRYPSASAMLDDIEANSRADGPTRADFKPRREKRGGRRALLVLATFALVLLGAGAAAASVGYVDLRALATALPGQGTEREEAVAPAEPVERAPLEAPAPPEETVAAPEATAAPQEQALVPVPAMDSYFDYYARDVLRSQGLQANIVREYREGYAPTGVVWGTDPVPGTLVPEGSTVTVYATPQDEEQVPEVVLPDVSSN